MHKLIIFILIIFLLAGTAQATMQVVASNTIRASNDTEQTNTFTNQWQSFHSFSPSVNGTGTYNLSWQYRCGFLGTDCDDENEIANTKVQKNGIDITSVYTTQSLSYVDVNITINGLFNTSDVFELYIRKNASQYVYARNFRLQYDESKWIVGSNGYAGWQYNETFAQWRIFGSNPWDNVRIDNSNGTLILSPEVSDQTHWYRLDRTTFDENLTNQITGTEYNSTWGNGSIGDAWIGNGIESSAGSNITLSDDNSFNLTGKNFTFFARVNPTGCPNGANAILDKSRWDEANQYGYFFDMNTACQVRILVSTTGSDVPLAQGTALPLNQWTNITGIGNGTHLLIYYEDVLKDTAILPGNPFASSSRAGIGGTGNHPDHHWQGKLDDVMLWNSRALNQTERQKVINNTHYTSGNFTFNHTWTSGFQGQNISIISNSNSTSDYLFNIYASLDDLNYNLVINNASNNIQYTINLSDRANKQYYRVQIVSSTNTTPIIPLNNITVYGESYIKYSRNFTGYPTNLSGNSSFNVSILSDNSKNYIYFRFKTNSSNYYEIPYYLNNSATNNVTLYFSSASIIGTPNWSNINSITADSISAQNNVNATSLVINANNPLIAFNERFAIDYYGWYRNPQDNTGNGYSHWWCANWSVTDNENNICESFYPVNGYSSANGSLYSSVNQSDVNNIFKYINDSGIRVVTFEWWEGDAATGVQMPLDMAFNAADNITFPPKITLFYDSSSASASASNFINRWQWFVDTYQNRTSYYRDLENGRPVVYIYNPTNVDSLSTWKTTISKLRGTQYDAVIMAHNIAVSDANNNGFDGVFRYDALSSAYNSQSEISNTNINKKLFAPTISAGYNDSKVRPLTPQSIDRNNGSYYENFFNNATFRDGATRFKIVTWNELLEGTGIEPADPNSHGNYSYQSYIPHPPTYYIDKTAQMIWNYSGLGQRPLLDYYGNSKTNNYSTRFNITSFDVVTFNVTSNRTADIRWYIDDILKQTNVSHPADTPANFTPIFLVGGLRKVQTNASNSNGTTATMYWEVTIPDITPPLSITNSTTITGNFFINNTWVNPTDADFDHIEFRNLTTNGLLTNLSNTTWNRTLTPHYTQNISAQTVDITGNVNTTRVWFNGTIPNNIPVLTNITNQTVNEGAIVFLDINCTDADSDTCTFSNNQTNNFIDWSTSAGTGNWTTNTSSSGIYYIDIGVTDGYGGQSNYTMTITINNLYFIPPVPTMNSTISGNFYVNATWTAGAGNITNGYNVTINGAWSNSSNDYRNTSLSAHAWHNITVWAYNSTNSSLSLTSLTNNTQIPNNIPTLSNTTNQTVNEGNTVFIDIDGNDSDNDTLTFSNNRTDIFNDFNTSSGTGNWTTNYSSSGTTYVDIGITDNYGGQNNYTLAITINDINLGYVPPTPIINSTITGNFYVNTSWTAGAGNITNTYNVSTNGAWTNGSSNAYHNSSLSAHAWHNITAWAFNTSAGNISTTSLTNNTQIPNNVPIMNSIGNKNVNEGEWLNFSVNGTDLDNDSLSCATTATKGTLSSCNFNWSTTYSDSGTYIWTYYLNDTYSGTDYETITITVNNVGQYYIPPVPATNSVSTGNFYVNFTWTVGAGNVTNGYNVSVNGAWANTSNTYHNSTLSAHAWHNVTVWAFNNTGNNLSLTSLTNNTQIPNNNLTQVSIGAKTVNEGDWLNFTVSSSDLDLDIMTYGTNATNGTFSTSNGNFNWSTNSSSSGIYYWYYNSSDGYGSTGNETVMITVNDVTIDNPPNITGWSNTNTSNNTLTFTVQQNTNITFNITINQSVTTTWGGTASPTKINGTNEDVSYAYKNFTTIGTFTVIPSCTNVNGTCTNIPTWTIIVNGTVTTYNISGYISNTLGAYLKDARVDFNNSFTLTDANGYYSFSSVNEGEYTTLARAIGYRNSTNSTEINSNTTINFTLNERKVSQVVSTPGFEIIISLITMITIYIMIRKRKNINNKKKI